ncbi:MAG: hypothetical protein R3E86_00990 [Pseudomonadales bacterium]
MQQMIDSSPLRTSARRSRRIVDVIRWTLVLLAVGLTGWAFLQPGGFGVVISEQFGGDERIQAWQSIALAALAVTQIALWFLATTSLSRVLGCLAGADTFPPQAAEHAARAARLMWVALIGALLSQPIGSVLATWTRGEGERLLSLQLSTSHLAALIAVLLMGFMAQALRLAAALWQDHREIV